MTKGKTRKEETEETRQSILWKETILRTAAGFIARKVSVFQKTKKKIKDECVGLAVRDEGGKM